MITTKRNITPTKQTNRKNASPLSTSHRKPTTSNSPSHTPRILILDDDPIILKFMARALGSQGYQVTTSKDSSETIEIYQTALQKNTPFDAVLLDATIPGNLSGETTLAHLKELNPNVISILCSGHSEYDLSPESLNAGFKAILSNPFTIKQLTTTLSPLLNN